MKRFYAILAVLTVVVGQSTAASKVVEQAEFKIRRLITRSSSWNHVYFTRSSETFLSLTESKVNGQGVASKANGWDGVPFRYSIKVRKSDLKTRDAQVEFADGTKFNPAGDWDAPGSFNRDVSIESPVWYETVHSDRANFSGTARGGNNVTVTVYDRQGRQRAKETVRPYRDRWSLSIALPPGTYRAVASRGRWEDGDEVRFNMRRHEGGWGTFSGRWNWGDFVDRVSDDQQTDKRPDTADERVAISTPYEGQRFRKGSNTFRGTSSDDSVDVEITRDGKRMYFGRITVVRGTWSFTTRTDLRGTYHLIVKTHRTGQKREVKFSVD